MHPFTLLLPPPVMHDGRMFGSGSRASFAVFVAVLCFAASAPAQRVFNVRDYGATGRKSDDARRAIQKAIDACGKVGGGRVYLPPGEYTSGQLHLRSGVRLYVDSGATLYASLDGHQYDDAKKAALLYGEDLHDIAIEGGGTLDGQASYEWRLNEITDHYILPNQRRMEATGKPLMRSFPAGFGKETVYPRMVLLIRATDVRIAGLKFIRSRSWTINPYACKHLVIDGIYIYSAQKEAVWADGIDPDGCQDVRIANCTIETGDDAICFYSTPIWGPVLPTENVTVINCRLSSSSAAIKFCDGNSKAVRHVAISNVIITDSNRGLAFMVFDGGIVEDVVIDNVVIDCRRFDWFWWGEGDPIHFNIKRRSEIDGRTYENEPRAGVIRNVTISNVIAHGQGTSAINGHPDSWLEGIRFNHVRLFVSHAGDAPYDDTAAAMTLRYARDFAMSDVEIRWEEPHAATWQSGLTAGNVQDLQIENSRIDAAPGSEEPALRLADADGVLIRQSRLPSIHLAANSKGVRLADTDARTTADPGAAAPIVR